MTAETQLQPMQEEDLSVNVARDLTHKEYGELEDKSNKRIAEIMASDGAKTPAIERLIDVHQREAKTANYLAEIALTTDVENDGEGETDDGPEPDHED